MSSQEQRRMKDMAASMRKMMGSSAFADIDLGFLNGIEEQASQMPTQPPPQPRGFGGPAREDVFSRGPAAPPAAPSIDELLRGLDDDEAKEAGEAAPPAAPGDPSAEENGLAVWRVVGGGVFGGLVVSKAHSMQSQTFDARLAVGSLARQLAVHDGRMHVERLTGKGPTRGWVNIRQNHWASNFERVGDPEEALKEAERVAAEGNPDAGPLDGQWTARNGLGMIIEDTKVFWLSDASSSDLVRTGRDTYTHVLEATGPGAMSGEVNGRLVNSDTLEWEDGDVWSREVDDPSDYVPPAPLQPPYVPGMRADEAVEEEQPTENGGIQSIDMILATIDQAEEAQNVRDMFSGLSSSSKAVEDSARNAGQGVCVGRGKEYSFQSIHEMGRQFVDAPGPKVFSEASQEEGENGTMSGLSMIERLQMEQGGSSSSSSSRPMSMADRLRKHRR